MVDVILKLVCDRMGYIVAFKKKGAKNWASAFAPEKGSWTKSQAHEALLFHKKHGSKGWTLRVIKR